MEYITASGTRYECQTVTTGANQITFNMQGQEIAPIEAAFREVTELEVSAEDNMVYGKYEHLSFESATVFEDGSVQVIMHIPDTTELRLLKLEATQLEQDTVIAQSMFGGEAE